MDTSIISALAALTGAAVGGLTSGIGNWINHRSQVRAQWLNHERNRRQILYKDFIEERRSATSMHYSTVKPTFPALSVCTPS
jgi:hypothetical protein